MCMDFIHSPFPETSFRFRVNFRSLKKPDLPSVTMKIKIKPGESNGYAYYEEDGTYRGTIFIFNTSDKDIVPEKGIVGGITLNPGSPVKKNDLKLAGDLGFESQPDDFGQVLGYQLTNYVSMSTYTSYEWYFEDQGYYTSLQAQYGEDGKLSTVWLMNNADLRN